MSTPYREPSTRVDEPPGPRWGATWIVKRLVRLFRFRYAERRALRREELAYYRRVAEYEDEVAARRRGEDPTRRPRPLPPFPLPPPRRILE